MRNVGLLLGCVLLVVACGEPEVDLDVPARATGQQVLDLAGLLGGSEVAARLESLPEDGHDVVAVTFESPDASAGHADRAGRLVLDEWGVDVVLIAVAVPGDFTSTAQDRRRFFGVVPADRFAVSGNTREEIVDELAPPLAAGNDWAGVFVVALDAVAEELTRADG